MNTDLWRPITDCLSQWEKQTSSMAQAFESILAEIEEVASESEKHLRQLQQREAELERREKAVTAATENLSELVKQAGDGSPVRSNQLGPLQEQLQRFLDTAPEDRGNRAGPVNNAERDELRITNAKLIAELSIAKGKSTHLQRTVQLQNEMLRQQSSLATELSQLRRMLEGQYNVITHVLDHQTNDHAVGEGSWNDLSHLLNRSHNDTTSSD